MNRINDVKQFMLAANQTVDTYNEQQAELYLNLIIEEYEELIEAVNTLKNLKQKLKDGKIENNSLTIELLRYYESKIIDANFDLDWVNTAYLLSKGYNYQKIWVEGARSNFDKIDPTTGKMNKREDGKVIKPEGWTGPDFLQFVKTDVSL